jgi:hypothetical protein
MVYLNKQYESELEHIYSRFQEQRTRATGYRWFRVEFGDKF